MGRGQTRIHFIEDDHRVASATQTASELSKRGYDSYGLPMNLRQLAGIPFTCAEYR